MKDSVTRAGLATLACAVLNGVHPAELEDASVADDVVLVPGDHPFRVVDHVRRLSTNSTGDGISTGSWVAIIAGSAAAVILAVGGLWWAMCRKPPMYTPANKGGYAQMPMAPMTPFGDVDVPDARNLPPDFFHGEGASAGQQEMPLLRLSANGPACGRV